MRLLIPRHGDLTDSDLERLYAVPDRSVPILRMNFVTSTDGAVALDGYSAGLSGGADKRVFALLRDYCDALLVAAGTLRHEGYRELALPPERAAKRVAAGLPAHPTLVIASSRLDLAPDHPAFAAAPVRPIVLTHENAPADRRKALDDVADVLVCGEREADLPAALRALAARGLAQVLCEGGPHLFGSLTAAGAVDELCLTIAPLLAGPGAGRITAGPPSPPARLTLAHAIEADNYLLLRYTR
jgi:riboflavin biosynthesis pyrimidine reductase